VKILQQVYNVISSFVIALLCKSNRTLKKQVKQNNKEKEIYEKRIEVIRENSKNRTFKRLLALLRKQSKK
jgi:transposase